MEKVRCFRRIILLFILVILTGCAATTARPALDGSPSPYPGTTPVQEIHTSVPASLFPSPTPEPPAVPKEIEDIFQYDLFINAQNGFLPDLMGETLQVQIFTGSDTINYYDRFGRSDRPTLGFDLRKELKQSPSVYWFVFPSHYYNDNGYVVHRIAFVDNPIDPIRYDKTYIDKWLVNTYSIHRFYFCLNEGESISSDSIIEFFDTINITLPWSRFFRVPIDLEGDYSILSNKIFTDISMKQTAIRSYIYGEPPACIDEMRKKWDHLNKTLPREIENSIKHRQEDEIINHYEYDYGELVYSLRDEYTYYILPDVPLKGVGFVRGALETSYTSFIYEKILYLTKDGKEFFTLNSYMRATEENQWILLIGWYMQKHTIDSDDYRMEIFRNLKDQMLTGTVNFDHQYRDDLYCTGDDPYHFLDEYILSPEHKERFGHNERQP